MKRKAEAEAVQEGTDAQEEEEVKQKLHQLIAQSIFLSSVHLLSLVCVGSICTTERRRAQAAEGGDHHGWALRATRVGRARAPAPRRDDTPSREVAFFVRERGAPRGLRRAQLLRVPVRPVRKRAMGPEGR